MISEWVGYVRWYKYAHRDTYIGGTAAVIHSLATGTLSHLGWVLVNQEFVNSLSIFGLPRYGGEVQSQGSWYGGIPEPRCCRIPNRLAFALPAEAILVASADAVSVLLIPNWTREPQHDAILVLGFNVMLQRVAKSTENVTNVICDLCLLLYESQSSQRLTAR